MSSSFELFVNEEFESHWRFSNNLKIDPLESWISKNITQNTKIILTFDEFRSFESVILDTIKAQNSLEVIVELVEFYKSVDYWHSEYESNGNPYYVVYNP